MDILGHPFVAVWVRLRACGRLGVSPDVASSELHLSLESTCRSFEVGVGSSDVGSTVGVDWSEEDMRSLR